MPVLQAMTCLLVILLIMQNLQAISLESRLQEAWSLISQTSTLYGTQLAIENVVVICKYVSKY